MIRDFYIVYIIFFEYVWLTPCAVCVRHVLCVHVMCCMRTCHVLYAYTSCAVCVHVMCCIRACTHLPIQCRRDRSAKALTRMTAARWTAQDWAAHWSPKSPPPSCAVPPRCRTLIIGNREKTQTSYQKSTESEQKTQNIRSQAINLYYFPSANGVYDIINKGKERVMSGIHIYTYIIIKNYVALQWAYTVLMMRTICCCPWQPACYATAALLSPPFLLTIQSAGGRSPQWRSTAARDRTSQRRPPRQSTDTAACCPSDDSRREY